MTPRRAAIALAVVLVLATISASRIRLSTADSRRPLLFVSLRLPASSDVDEVARSWVREIESAIRAVAVPELITGRVLADGAQLRIILPSGDDPVAKAARISAELEPLRARLPEGGALSVAAWEEGSAGEFMILLLRPAEESATGIPSAEAQRLRDEMLSIRGIREVRLLGISEPAWVVRPDAIHGSELAASIGSSLRRSAARPLGNLERDGRLVPLVSRDRDGGIADTQVIVGGTLLPLREVASIERARSATDMKIRVDGRSAAALVLDREPDAPLLGLDRAVRRRAARARAEVSVFYSEADTLRVLLRRSLAALVVLSLFFSLAGVITEGRRGLTLGLVPATALAGAVLLLFLLDRAIDSAGVAPVVAAVLLTIPFGLLVRREGLRGRLLLGLCWAGAMALVPLAIEIIASVASLEIAADAALFTIAAVGSALACLLLPAAASGALPVRWSARFRAMLRTPVTVLLAAGVVLFVLFSLFGTALDPRNRSFEGKRDRLRAQLQFAEGGSVERAEELLARLEEEVLTLDHVERVVVLHDGAFASLHLELDREGRRRHEWNDLSLRLQYILAATGVGFRVLEPERSGGLSGLAEETRAETDDEAQFYRVILRSASAADLDTAVQRIRDRISAAGLTSSSVIAEGQSRQRRIEIEPFSSAPPASFASLNHRLEAADGILDRIERPGTTPVSIVVRPWWSPPTVEEELLPLHELMGEGALFLDESVESGGRFAVREAVAATAVAREGGRFLQPVRIVFPWLSKDRRTSVRSSADRIASTIELPAGVDLERPSLEPLYFNERRLRLIGLFAVTPVLFWLFGALILNHAFLEPLIALCGPLLAAGLAAAWLSLSSTPLSSSAMLAILAGGASSLFVSLVVLARSLGPRRNGELPRIYRAARRHVLPLGIAAAAMLLAFVVVGAGVDAAAYPWKETLVLATLPAAGSLLAVAVVPAAALLILGDARRLARTVAERRRTAEQWLSLETRPRLETQSLTKIYPNGFQALSGVSIRLEPSIVALLGPNGAGKSTLIRIMTGLLSATRGELSFKGVPVRPETLMSYRRVIGYLPQEFNAYPEFSAEQFLDYWALEAGMTDRRQRRDEIEQLLVVVGLEEHATRKVRDFSGGMRQRVGIARSLLGAPPVIIVDEPTTGLDIESRQRLRAVLRTIAVHRIVILSTHIASDVEGTASRVLLLDHGRLLFDGNPLELKRRAAGLTFEALVTESGVREISHEYRITARVPTIDGIRVRGVALPDQPLPGPRVAPGLEEGYLSVIDAAEGGRSRGRRYALIRRIFDERTTV